MERRRLRLRLGRQYEALLKILLLAKQGRISLREAHLRDRDSFFEADLLVEAPQEKTHWFMEKAKGSPYTKSFEETQ